MQGGQRLLVEMTTPHGRPDVVLVRVTGDVDHRSAPTLRAILGRAVAGRPTEVHLDLSRVTFFSCAGLTVMLSIREAADGRLKIVGTAVTIERVLHLLGVSPLFGRPDNGPQPG